MFTGSNLDGTCSNPFGEAEKLTRTWDICGCNVEQRIESGRIFLISVL